MHRQVRMAKKKKGKQQRVREGTAGGAEIPLQLTGKLHWSRYFPVANDGPW